MVSTHITVFASLLLLASAFHSVTAGLDEDHFKELPKKIVAVQGMVYCQSCKKLGTSSLSEAEPIPLARVRVTCINHRGYVFFYKEYTANEDGYFYAKLEGFSMDHLLLDHPLTSCKVTPVSSPIESCNVLTNVNNGITGASLRHEHKRLIARGCDTVIYAAGPLAFHPAECHPDGTHY